MPRFAHNLVWVAVAGALLASGPAQAQLSPDWNRCVNRDGRSTPDSVFTACSNVISLGTDAKNLAIAYGKRGNAHHDKGEYDRAIADYTRAVELNANDAVVYNNRGIAYRAKGDNDSAIADYKEVTGSTQGCRRLQQSRRRLSRQGQQRPRHRRPQQGHRLDPSSPAPTTTAALPIAPRATTTAPSPITARRSESIPKYGKRLLQPGSAYRAKGDNDRAIEDATATIEINPRHISAYYSRGLALAAKGNYDRAIADYTKVIEINPKHDGAYQHRSLAYRAKGDDNRAVADHTTAAEIIRNQRLPRPRQASPASRLPRLQLRRLLWSQAMPRTSRSLWC